MTLTPGPGPYFGEWIWPTCVVYPKTDLKPDGGVVRSGWLPRVLNFPPDLILWTNQSRMCTMGIAGTHECLYNDADVRDSILRCWRGELYPDSDMAMNVSEMTVLWPGLDYGRTLLTSAGFSVPNSGCGCVSPIAVQGLPAIVLLSYDHMCRCSPRSCSGWVFSSRWSAGAVSQVFIYDQMTLLLLLILLPTYLPASLPLVSRGVGCPDVWLPLKGGGASGAPMAPAWTRSRVTCPPRPG